MTSYADTIYIPAKSSCLFKEVITENQFSFLNTFEKEIDKTPFPNIFLNLFKKRTLSSSEKKLQYASIFLKKVMSAQDNTELVFYVDEIRDNLNAWAKSMILQMLFEDTTINENTFGYELDSLWTGKLFGKSIPFRDQRYWLKLFRDLEKNHNSIRLAASDREKIKLLMHISYLNFGGFKRSF